MFPAASVASAHALPEGVEGRQDPLQGALCQQHVNQRFICHMFIFTLWVRFQACVLVMHLISQGPPWPLTRKDRSMAWQLFAIS